MNPVKARDRKRLYRIVCASCAHWGISRNGGFGSSAVRFRSVRFHWLVAGQSRRIGAGSVRFRIGGSRSVPPVPSRRVLGCFCSPRFRARYTAGMGKGTTLGHMTHRWTHARPAEIIRLVVWGAVRGTRGNAVARERCDARWVDQWDARCPVCPSRPAQLATLTTAGQRILGRLVDDRPPSVHFFNQFLSVQKPSLSTFRFLVQKIISFIFQNFLIFWTVTKKKGKLVGRIRLLARKDTFYRGAEYPINRCLILW